jgi:hypothetical protein
MECYVPYETRKQKKYIIDKGNYLLKSSCCDYESCNQLETDIQDTRFKCNDLFGIYHKDNLDEKGNILSDSLCSELREKENRISGYIRKFTKQAGTRNKHKISRKKTKKTKKYRSRRYKRYSSNK